jgi:Mor family transcriptional regulator
MKPSHAHIPARNRRIVNAARAGASYVELAQRFGLSRCQISIICTRAGYRRKPRKRQ